MGIDRQNPIPFYLQVIEELRTQIRNGQLGVGTQLPGEMDLCATFNVSRTVIRQALNELDREGLIIREKGRGTFVAQPKIKEKFFQKLSGFYQDMVDQGYQPVTKVLSQHVIPASAKIAEKLAISPQTSVIQIERQRFIDDEPIVYVTSYLPFDFFPDLVTTDLSNQSLYEFLELQCGVFITRGIRTIEAVSATKRESQLLNIKIGAPLILLDSVSYDAKGTPVEYYHALHRGDRSRFEVELVRVRNENVSMIRPASLETLPPGNLVQTHNKASEDE